ncbi:MAG: hypothetical protein P8L68_12630 [Paracoccaceae bacterium]|nr:hypothetical protein [Paracoccaceae bacterium]MDG2259329.1 hypothetical protein [Paracoccaceae bacterium]
MIDTLDQELLNAHERGDKSALVTLYSQAAEAATSDDAKYFYMTHAFIFALDVGHPNANLLRAELIAAGREA